LNNNEKYKLGLIYIEMLEKPDDFKFLDRFAGDNDSNKVQMILQQPDLDLFKQLENTIQENKDKKL